MIVRRRAIDDWANVRVGDIVSFDTDSKKCPSGGYVHAIRRRDDGKLVLTLTGESVTEVVEHTSYRLRIEERSLMVRLQEPGAPLAWTDVADAPSRWSMHITYDFAGRAPFTARIALSDPVRVTGYLRWNALRTKDLRDNTDLILEAFSNQPGPPRELFGREFPGERRAWRRYNPATRSLEPATADELNLDLPPLGPPNPHTFTALDGDTATSDKLNRVIAWVYDHRHEFDDPGQPPRQRPDHAASTAV